MTTKIESKLQGNFNWRVPSVIGGFVEGSEGGAFLDEFNERADADYQGNRNIKVLSYSPEGQVATGSNPFAVVHANQVLRANNLPIRIATPADLGVFVDSGALPLRGQYEDVALVLRGNGDSYDLNNPLARNLFSQIKSRGIEASPKNPVMIPLVGLDLDNDENQYGLAFQLRDDAELIEAPELAHKNNGNTFSRTDERGLPIFDKNGNRTLHTRNEGLSGLFLSRVLGLVSARSRLGGSSSDGRVVFVSGAAGANSLTQQYIAEVNKAYEAQKSELDVRRDKALALLRGIW